MSNVTTPSQAVWVAGRGEINLEQESADRRLQSVIAEFDPEGKLTLGRHNGTGEWVLFLKPRANPFGLDAPYPVLGLGHETPSPDFLRAVLRETDTRRNGDEILKKIQDNNERLRKPARDAADEAIERVAETAESFLHREGKTPYHRSLAKRDPIHRAYSTRKD